MAVTSARATCARVTGSCFSDQLLAYTPSASISRPAAPSSRRSHSSASIVRGPEVRDLSRTALPRPAARGARRTRTARPIRRAATPLRESNAPPAVHPRGASTLGASTAEPLRSCGRITAMPLRPPLASVAHPTAVPPSLERRGEGLRGFERSQASPVSAVRGSRASFSERCWCAARIRELGTWRLRSGRGRRGSPASRRAMLGRVVPAARRGPRQVRFAQVQLALDAAARIVLQLAAAQQCVEVLALRFDEPQLQLVGQPGELLL